MRFRRFSLSMPFGVLLIALTPAVLSAQTTTINIGSSSSPIQTNVQRLGINLGQQAFYDSGQMLKNLVFTNPSFEGEIYHSTIGCVSGSSNSCTDANIFSGFTGGFWNQASYTVISGAAVGRTGTVCSFSGANYPNNGGTFTFCDSGTAPAQGDYIVVKRTMPASLGWPGGDWQTAVGAGTFTPETYDMPPGTLGTQSALLTAPTASDSIAVNTFFDSTANKTFVQLNGSYQLTFKAKGIAGQMNLAILLTRGQAGLTYINQTVPLTNAWQTYTINFTGNENGTAIGKVELSFTAAGPDTVELDDVSLVKTGTDPTNTTVFRDEVVNALQAAHPGVIRMWEDQLGESLDNMIASPTGKQRSAYTPYNGYDGTDVNFQTQTAEFGLTDFLQLCQKVGADPWIVVPSTFSTGEAYNLVDYLSGSSTTPYGAKRAAAGQTAPWSTVFKQMHLEFGNEEWNGGTFKGGAIELAPAYGQAASSIFTAIKGNPSYVSTSYDLIVNGQSTAPYNNQTIQSYTTNNDSFSVAPYMMYNITSSDTIDHLFGTTFAEAEAFVTLGASAEGVSNGFINSEQNLVGKPIVTSEMNLSPSSGTMNQATMNGYASSVGGGIAVIDAMMQQLRAGVRTQNLFELPGYISNTNINTTMYLWGALVDMGPTSRPRPQYLALQLANSAIGSATTELQTTHTGANPTDYQYDYAVNTVTLPTFHYLQSFAFTAANGANSLVVFNVNPDYAETVNFGTNAPTGTVVMQQLTSGSITDTNEASNVVATTSTTLNNFNASTPISLPAYSMTVFTWGGTATAPVISSVQATSVSPTSETVTWTTDQPSSSQLNYGTTTSYGSSSALNSTLVTSHSVTLTGLTAGTTYDFDVVSTNGSSLTSTSSNSSFLTATVPPVISAVTVSAITSTGATITWTTDQSSSSLVAYGTTTSYGSSSAGTAGVTSHSVTLTGLTPGTTYDFSVTSANNTNASSSSTNSSFATLTVAPVISVVTATSITSTSATITWTTDQASTSRVAYGTTSAYGTLSALNSTLVTSHSVTITGLTPGTTYYFDVTSANSAGQSATTGASTFATTTVPPVISAVAATSITTTSATITWTTDQNSSSQVSYGTTTAYGTQSALNSTLSTAHSVTLTGLTPGTTYDFDVTSANSASASATSSNATFTTTAVPPVISAIAATGLTTTSATITWTTDQASSSQVFYGTTTGYGSQSALSSALVTSHSVTLTGLTQGTTYDFDVASTNSASMTATSANSTFATVAPPVISAVSATNVTSTSATITWTTNQASSSQVAYGTTTSYGTQTTLNSALVTSHSVAITGLTPGTTYDFDVTSANASAASTTSPNATFVTTAAPVISAVASSGITSTSATITWTTDQPSSSLVNYGTTLSYGTQSALNSALVTSHSVTITGLTQGTTYDFDVVSVNGSTASSTSPNATFATTAVAPVISGVVVSGSTTTTATINWTTDQPSTSQVFFGTTTAYGSSSALSSTLTTSHSVTITGLSPTTTYDFDVASTNAATLTATSPNSSFVTPAGTPPYVGYVAAWGINNSNATVTWSTDVPATAQLAYGTTTALGQLTPLQTALTASHGVTLTGLISGTTYYFVAQSTGANGATGYSAVMSFTTLGTAPAGPPVISAVAATGITNTSATITWTTDQPSSSLVNYGTTTGYGSASTLDPTLVTSHSVTLTGLTVGTTYDFDVVSANSGAMSTTSANATFLTTSVVYTPPVITAVATTGVTSTSVTVTWTTDQPATSLVNYGTTTAYGSSSLLNSALVTAHSVTLTGLAAGTTYDFDVTSANTANQSTTSPNAIVATTASTATPPYVGYVAAWGINNSNATVTWSTDVPATAQLAYGTTTALGQLTPLQTPLTASHGVTLTGLNSGTTYYFVAQSTAATGATGYSSVMSFTTTGTQTTPAPIISAVAVSNITNTSATITWTTDQATSSQVNYGLTTTYTLSSTLSSTLVTSHSVTLTGLTPGTTYDFDVMSADSVAVSATSSNATFLTTGTAPTPVITNISSSSVTGSSAIITWTTDQASSSVVNYGTTTGYGSTASVATLVTTHSVTLTGLTANTTYNYDVSSTNAAGTTTTSSNLTFTTLSNTGPAPVISYLADYGITASGAIIVWSTDLVANTAVAYGTTTALGQLSPVQTTLSNSHGVTLTGLKAGTTYYFVAQSAGVNGSTGYSTTYSFTTIAGPPTISGVTVSPAANNTATVNWTTSAPTNSYVQYGTSAGNYGYYSALTNLTTTPFCTLSYVPSGTIHYQVVSTDANGNIVSSADATFTEP